MPLYRLPVMVTAQRKFSYQGAMLDFSITHQDGQPGGWRLDAADHVASIHINYNIILLI